MKNQLIKSAAIFISGFAVCLIILLTLGNSSTETKSAVAIQSGEFPQEYKIVSPKFPESLSFAGEGVPIENFEVFERIDREILVNTYWHSATILTFKGQIDGSR